MEASVGGGPGPVLENLMKEFLEHNKGKDLDDDVTLAVALIK